MKTTALLTILVSLLTSTPCVAQQQLAWPVNPQLGGFPPGHPGVPTMLEPNKSGERSEWNAADLKIGDRVNVFITGELARKCVRLIGLTPPQDDFSVPLICTVERKLGDDRLELKGERIDVNHTGKQLTDNDEMRLMTFIANIHVKDLLRPHMWIDPAGPETMARKIEIAKMPTIRLTKTEGVKIRSWALVHDIGE